MKLETRLAAMSLAMCLTGVGLWAQTTGVQTVDVVRPGQGVTNPVLIKEVKPVYTADALTAKIQGIVELEVTVLPDGSVDASTIVVTKSLDKNHGLDDQAKEAAKGWKFQPGSNKATGQPVAVRVGIEMSFQPRDTRTAIQFDSKGIDFGPWLNQFTRIVKQNWLTPQAAITMSGHVVVHLNVHKDGALTDIEIFEPSSIESFNVAAVNALKKSNPGIALPTAYPVDPMAMTVIFYYNEHK